MDARALAALAANPGCRRRALMDAAGVDKGALSDALGAPARFGQSRFAFSRGHAFEARVKKDGCAELLRLLGAEGRAELPDLAAPGPEGRVHRTRIALAEAAPGTWTLLDHPLLALDVAGSTAYLEPDAVAVAPDGTWTVVEIKSFPILDGGADATKVGAAARQSAVYVLALDALAPGRTRPEILLVCPKDFSNLPTADRVDIRKQLAVTRRQLTRLTRIADIADALPEGTTFDLAYGPDGRTPTRPRAELAAAVEAVPAAYAPECLSTCELAFHCRDRSRADGRVEALGRSLRGELGGLTTVEAVLAAAHGEAGDPDDPAVGALRRAAALRAEALTAAAATVPASRSPEPPAPPSGPAGNAAASGAGEPQTTTAGPSGQHTAAAAGAGGPDTPTAGTARTAPRADVPRAATGDHEGPAVTKSEHSAASAAANGRHAAGAAEPDTAADSPPTAERAAAPDAPTRPGAARTVLGGADGAGNGGRR
ncbi:hypothetical protein SAMN05216259_107108 [Actinacidiphila guanduensis]|uniref:Secreted protein n=1 Tax=Actinacidiphila guanduensis TaxID=310781 RepID=A0A1H0GG17_9ACTN|nr:hypothetical protein SAMN05216259_107108 [Actinacidiphila guanduensis]